MTRPDNTENVVADAPLSSEGAAPGRVDILGVLVSAVNPQSAVQRIEKWIAERSRAYVCVTGAHGVIESRRDPALREIHNNAGMVTPDGMPLVWLSKLKGFAETSRVYGPDLMRAVTAASVAGGYRQFYYGGAPGVALTLASKLEQAHPGLIVAGSYCPPFRDLTAQEDAEMVAAINAARPDIIWVGLSTPKQERWMARHRQAIEAPVMVGVGAAFDFLSGSKRQAPAWIQRNGLEWLYRLLTEPRRLWRRYAYIVPTFLALSAASLARDALARVSAGRRATVGLRSPAADNRP